MSCILDKHEPYWCEADWNCKDCPNCGAKMVEPQESEIENGNDV